MDWWNLQAETVSKKVQENLQLVATNRWVSVPRNAAMKQAFFDKKIICSSNEDFKFKSLFDSNTA